MAAKKFSLFISNLKEWLLKNQNFLTLPKPWDVVLLSFLSIVITIPLFLILHQNLIIFDSNFYLDRILFFLLIVIILYFILHFLKKVILLISLIYLLFLMYGTIFGNYGFTRVFEDYRYMVFSMKENPRPQDIIISKLLPFPNKSKIIKAVEYDNPKIRNFAISCTTKHFLDIKKTEKTRLIIQCFAIFKEINSKWNYVNDPKGREYIANATESIKHFSGDCDDHAIFMAACIKAIGGTPRIIHTGGHLYPEMLIGTTEDFEKAVFLIKQVLFVNESKNQEIHYHIDERNQIWINLDYTGNFPGGKFMSEEILGALTL